MENEDWLLGSFLGSVHWSWVFFDQIMRLEWELKEKTLKLMNVEKEWKMKVGLWFCWLVCIGHGVVLISY